MRSLSKGLFLLALLYSALWLPVVLTPKKFESELYFIAQKMYHICVYMLEINNMILKYDVVFRVKLTSVSNVVPSKLAMSFGYHLTFRSYQMLLVRGLELCSFGGVVLFAVELFIHHSGHRVFFGLREFSFVGRLSCKLSLCQGPPYNSAV